MPKGTLAPLFKWKKRKKNTYVKKGNKRGKGGEITMEEMGMMHKT